MASMIPTDADGIELYSGLDDLFYDVTLTDASTGAALTSGTVVMRLCTPGTTTAVDGTSASSCTLSHVAAGRWTGVHDDAAIATAIAGLATSQRLHRVLLVSGQRAAVLAVGKRVPVEDSALAA